MKQTAFLVAMTVLSSLATLYGGDATSPKPNILFIMADDQAPWALGVSGNRQAVTPNMDKLAHAGAYFPNAFTPTPVCSPSRVSILTSRYGSELGITEWINPTVDVGVGLDAKIL